MQAQASIYATIAPKSKDSRSRNARQKLRALRESRLTQRADGPELSLDRMGPIISLLRQYREDREGHLSAKALSRYLQHLKAEVEALERWADARSTRLQKDGATIRRALEFLRTFGHVTALDFSSIPIEERSGLVTLLALEHRWCYAAAGTTRGAFKVATGRTGAR